MHEFKKQRVVPQRTCTSLCCLQIMSVCLLGVEDSFAVLILISKFQTLCIFIPQPGQKAEVSYKTCFRGRISSAQLVWSASKWTWKSLLRCSLNITTQKPSKAAKLKGEPVFWMKTAAVITNIRSHSWAFNIRERELTAGCFQLCEQVSPSFSRTAVIVLPQLSRSDNTYMHNKY